MRSIHWGIVGGMGPLASAAFLQSIYDTCELNCDQDAPPVILDADSSCPDRTQLLLGGAEQRLADHLQARIERLVRCGADRIVICCVSMHGVLDRIDTSSRSRVQSLIDLMASDVIRRAEPQLVFCTDGTTASGVLQSHERWPQMGPWLIFPKPADQRVVHSLLYALKRGEATGSIAKQVEELVRKYSVGSFLAACTDLHLLTRQYEWTRTGVHNIRCVDPLYTAAELISGASAGGPCGRRSRTAPPDRRPEHVSTDSR